MAYSIVYNAKQEQKSLKGNSRRVLLTAFVFLGFLLGVFLYWESGREVLQVMLIPEDAAVTLHAVDVFAQELGSGFSVADASRNFCEAVFKNGYSD